MFHRIFATGLVAGAVLIASGCEEGSPAGSPPPPRAVAAEDVVGDWVLERSSIHDAAFNAAKRMAEERGIQLSDAEIERRMDPIIEVYRTKTPSYTLAADGTFTGVAGEFTTTGTWSLNGDILTLHSPGFGHDPRFRVTDGLLTIIPQRGGRVVSLAKK